MGKKFDNAELFWKLFQQTGNIGYYSLYRSLKKESGDEKK
ncbi:MAG: YqzL family protein [Clostridiales bacterium]|nr:YqzL family protein [Clostridiales bacterium]